ncbi:SDR family oxidoreductase [Modestobacter versicolor]|uniref:NAD(P)-dependent oxidoreductase n=1 Tax=Modestobacter versicolor TaxID=429133 RepID=A0A323VB45_9ACTN|nr:SDR family oxidoreductase [Modestobacter versicolor]MBB3678320.1 NAD(P)H dehydrogenase (quinone) [Modestobacter versicolor]PZA22102.1 NAD(P)-dependent oxidoreductase [Modestobacter versicolor]
MIAVTGATGHLGHLVVTGLLEAGVPAAEVVAIVRSPAKAADLAERGVQVRQADYSDEAALVTALQGVDRLLLVSGSEVGQRVAQHGNVLQAAKTAGVELVVYTSAPKADDTPLPLAPEHIATERLIADFGIPAVVLRNNWYLENYDQPIRQAAETGELTGSSGEGRIAAATRADFAAAAVAVLTAEQPPVGVHELGGDQAFSFAELAAAVSAEAGREVTYRALTAEEHLSSLLAAGLPEGTAQFVVGLDQSIAQGALDTGSTALSQLTGRPTTTLAEHVRAVLGAGTAA